MLCNLACEVSDLNRKVFIPYYYFGGRKHISVTFFRLLIVSGDKRTRAATRVWFLFLGEVISRPIFIVICI